MRFVVIKSENQSLECSINTEIIHGAKAHHIRVDDCVFHFRWIDTCLRAFL
jgi:hypothetical protein